MNAEAVETAMREQLNRMALRWSPNIGEFMPVKFKEPKPVPKKGRQWRPETGPLDRAAVLRAISFASHIPITRLFGVNRSDPVAIARQAYCYVARVHVKSSYPKIAQMINRDHSTVHHAVEMVRTSPGKYAEIINEAERLLGLPVSDLFAIDKGVF